MTLDYKNAKKEEFILFGLEDGKKENDNSKEIISQRLLKNNKTNIYKCLVNYFYGYKLGRLKAFFDEYVPNQFEYSKEHNTIVSKAMPSGVFSIEVNDSIKIYSLNKAKEEYILNKFGESEGYKMLMDETQLKRYNRAKNLVTEKEFYKVYTHDKFPELLTKENRPYLILVVEVNGVPTTVTQFTSELKKICPEILIDFYESKIKFKEV